MNPMLFPLNIDSALRLLNTGIQASLSKQNMTVSSPSYGGWINPEHGLDEHGAGTSVLSGIFTLLWATAVYQTPLPLPEEEMHRHAAAAVEYQLRVQDELGLFNLRSCNYSSSPDAAFAVHRLGLGMMLFKPFLNQFPDWQEIYDRCELFMRRAVHGIIAGGFHTPNHRWVICGALSIAKQLFPDLSVDDTINAYLAEGMDVDPDGAYTEHSTGVYDAICNLCLLLTAQFGHPEVLEAVKANLKYNLHMLDANGEAETGLSHRQDFGQRPVPIELGAAYLFYQYFEPNTDFEAMAKIIWHGKENSNPMDMLWLVYIHHLTQFDLSSAAVDLPDFTRYFPYNQFWRMRQGDFSASVFSNRYNLLTANHAGAHLKAMSISQSYFGAGRFYPETIEPTASGVLLTSSGENLVSHRPGYDYPLGKPIPEFYSTREQREWRKLPPAKSILEIHPVENGLALNYRTIDNYPGVLAQIAFDFLPGGIWHCEGGAFQPQAGQVIFLTQGSGQMCYGEDCITIGPGADAHQYWQMRDTPPAPELVRVVIPLITPINHSFVIQSK